eukprot:SAG22_NODE_7799_length_707_cov_5.603618_1_plen_80_part_00
MADGIVVVGVDDAPTHGNHANQEKVIHYLLATAPDRVSPASSSVPYAILYVLKFHCNLPHDCQLSESLFSQMSAQLPTY